MKSRFFAVASLVIGLFFSVTAYGSDPIKSAMENAEAQIENCVMELGHVSISAKRLSAVVNGNGNIPALKQLAVRVQFDLNRFVTCKQLGLTALDRLTDAIELLLTAGGDRKYAQQSLDEATRLFDKLKALLPEASMVDDLRKAIVLVTKADVDLKAKISSKTSSTY